MIRIASQQRLDNHTEEWHEKLLELLPAIRRMASRAFRSLPSQIREDFVEEVVAHAVVAVKALHDRGKLDLAYAKPLAGYGIQRVRSGREVGVRQNIRDVSSRYCRQAKHAVLERLDHYDRRSGEWLETLVEDKHAGPAQTASARIDVADWFRKMSSRDRRIARALATGHGTYEVARRFGVSPGRISQKRKSFYISWKEFQAEDATMARSSRDRP